ncbi:leucine--tRNA ligase [Candidatus Beckwithbacteria bacterium]|nr:leucine--tRNA ligase [Candidatus Beckwithbacteria bacterium]
MKTYKHQQIESKWQKIWEEEKLNGVKLKTATKPYYNLMMYPYPSAEGLHVGNVYAFTGSDIHGRFMRMQGYDVFEPIGFDSGGIHSENFAIKMGVHPKQMTNRNIEHFTQQLKMIGNIFDWNHTVDVMNPDYYRWTQWLFIQLFKAGLAYKKKSAVTWCPSCKTTVSDEQTEKKGEKIVCERCKTEIERKYMSQWFFKITDYAQRLLDNTYKLNWPDKVLITQRNWIGKSEGAEVYFKLENYQDIIKVFTTRPDTLHGCTFFCLAPEHPLVINITQEKYKDSVSHYISETNKKTELERKFENKEKTGVFTGSYVINPINNEKIPVWIADYVLMDYGEGAVMGVPAHDKRDFEFAKKFNLAIKPVIRGNNWEFNPDNWNDNYKDEGKIINSTDWNDLQYPYNLKDIIKSLETKKIGKSKTTYKLRDWCISRQRYWGPPIPMIYCPSCAKEGKSWFTSQKSKLKNSTNMVGWYPVPEDQLPVELSEINDYLPDGSGKSPLARHPEFFETTCPVCGGKAQRETDVSDTFLDSSWYFLRYPSTAGGDISRKEASKNAFIPEITKKWLPVSQYCGGAEHSVLHLMYSRFITMALHDLKYLDFEEPFPNFYAHGLIIKDGAKMSKSRGNVVNPDEYIAKFGADVLRLYLSFMGPYKDGGDFRDSGIQGMEKFIHRFFKLFYQIREGEVYLKADISKLEGIRHETIKKVTYGYKNFKYNIIIASIMKYLNFLEDNFTDKPLTEENSKHGLLALKTIVLLIAPIAPHLAEELWQEFQDGKQFNSVHQQKWPDYDEKMITNEEVIIVIQVNGKKRGEIKVVKDKTLDQNYVLAKAKEDEKIKSYLKNQVIKKEIFVKGKLVNFVI